MRPLEERLEAVPAEVQEMVEGLDLTDLLAPVVTRLEAVAEDVKNLRRKTTDARLVARLEALEAQGSQDRLARLEKELRSQAVRLDEELAAVFEPNRVRVGEMTGTFDERMATLEEAADRVRELEDATIRSRAETGQVLHAAFERMEALTGKLSRFEDQLQSGAGACGSGRPSELRGAVTHLRAACTSWRPALASGPSDAESRQIIPDSFSAGEDPEEGLASADIQGPPTDRRVRSFRSPGPLDPAAAVLEKMVRRSSCVWPSNPSRRWPSRGCSERSTSGFAPTSATFPKT